MIIASCMAVMLTFAGGASHSGIQFGTAVFQMAIFRPAASAQTVAAPVITPAGGRFAMNAVVRVSIRADKGARVHYTLDGTIPGEGRGTASDGNCVFFDLPAGDVTVMAVAVKPGLPQSHGRIAVFTRVDP